MTIWDNIRSILSLKLIDAAISVAPDEEKASLSIAALWHLQQHPPKDGKPSKGAPVSP